VVLQKYILNIILDLIFIILYLFSQIIYLALGSRSAICMIALITIDNQPYYIFKFFDQTFYWLGIRFLVTTD